ncbi:hypothetical protein O9993_05130 [Vibrio lentus]|nr:hypothetical protein [Vibrio lentus]
MIGAAVPVAVGVYEVVRDEVKARIATRKGWWMSELLQYLNSIGLSPTTIAVIALLWKLDKRLTILEIKTG